MPVFDTRTQTKRRVKDPITDDTLPSGGGLNWGSIASSSALSGTTGADCNKVTGDRWQQIQGNLTQNYTGDKQIDVQGKHNETIMGDRSITVSAGNVSHTVSAGGVTDTIGQSYQASANMNYQVTAGMKHSVSATIVENDASGMATNTAGAVMTIQGALVKINC